MSQWYYSVNVLCRYSMPKNKEVKHDKKIPIENWLDINACIMWRAGNNSPL